MKMKELYSKQIFDGNGYYIDSVNDVMINVINGKAMIIGIITPTLEREKKMIPFKAIKSIGDIIILRDTD